MSRSDVPLNDPASGGEGMWPDPGGLWMETAPTGRAKHRIRPRRAVYIPDGGVPVTPAEAAGQILHLQVGIRYSWSPEPQEQYSPRKAAGLRYGWRHAWREATAARVAVALGGSSRWVLAFLGAVAFVTWSLVPLEAAAQALGGAWCLFALYAMARRGK